jgi:hypothetical protein
MPIDQTTSTTNTSGGVRGKIQFHQNQEHFVIPTETIQELAERGYIVLDKNDLIDALNLLLVGESDRLAGLIEALKIPQISKNEKNIIKLDADGDWMVSTADLPPKRRRIVQTKSDSGGELKFGWPANPFPDNTYTVHLTAKSDPGAVWSYSIVKKEDDAIEFKLYGITDPTTFELICEGNAPATATPT